MIIFGSQSACTLAGYGRFVRSVTRVYGICPSGSFFVEYVPIEDVDTLAEPWHNDG